ncbi:hypothetical protein K443DRAFT_597707 [Laccaria amethystina LaAM-08-1]|uniref:Uncharacterized protein n=1 Tax=Laccaria amethystina LaAM-08-1 TaxID=1095629 RepID=A0A0C9WQR1_9AGAR|nr:hypothetical protein K443DRAFT_597707 [Laccaria amethystina LaAM-08-1]
MVRHMGEIEIWGYEGNHEDLTWGIEASDRLNYPRDSSNIPPNADASMFVSLFWHIGLHNLTGRSNSCRRFQPPQTNLLALRAVRPNSVRRPPSWIHIPQSPHGKDETPAESSSILRPLVMRLWIT